LGTSKKLITLEELPDMSWNEVMDYITDHPEHRHLFHESVFWGDFRLPSDEDEEKEKKEPSEQEEEKSSKDITKSSPAEIEQFIAKGLKRLKIAVGGDVKKFLENAEIPNKLRTTFFLEQLRCAPDFNPLTLSAKQKSAEVLSEETLLYPSDLNRELGNLFGDIWK